MLVEDTEGYCAAQRVIADAPKGDRCGHDGETIFVEGDRAIAEESRCTPGTTCAPIAVNDAGNITEVACLPVDLIGEHQYEGSQFRCDLATHTIIDVEKGTEVRTLAWNETCRRVVTGDGQPVWIVNTLSEEELAELEASGLPVFSVSHDDASCLPNGNMRQEARTLLPPQGFTCVQVGDRVSFEPIGGPDAGRNGCVDDDGNTRNPYSSLHEGNSVRVCVPSLVDGHVIGYDWQTGTPNTCGLRAAGESWIDGTSCKTCIASGYIASQQLFTYTSFGRFVAPACGGFATTRTDESGRVIQEVVPDDFPGGHLPGFAYCDNHGQCQVIPPGTDSPQPVQTIGATSAYALRCPYNCAVAGSHSGERADGTTNRILDSRKECSFDGTSVVSYNIFGTRTGTRLCDSGICSAGACVPGAQVIDADTGNTLVCGVGQTCDVFDPWTGERVEQTVIAVTEGQDVRYEARSNYASEDLAQASRETQEQYVRENFHENYYEAFLASGQSFDEFQREQREAWERIQATIINLGVVDEAYMERVQSGEYVPTQLEATLTEQRGNVLAAGVLFFNDFTHGATRQGNELLLTNRERCRQKGLVQCWFDGDAAEFLRGGVMQGAAPAAFVAAIVAIPLGAPFIAAALPAGAVSAGTVATTSLLYGSTAFGAYSAVNSLQQTAQLCDGNHPGTILNQSSCPGAVVNSAVQFATLFGGAAAGQQMLEGRILVEAGTSARGAQLLTNAESAVNTGAQAAQSFRVARDLNIAISAGTTLYFGGLAYNSCINGTTDERGNRYVDAASCGTNIGMAVLSAARTGLAVAMPSNAQAAFRANLTADAGDVTVNGFQMALACSSGDINACSQAIGGTVASVGGLGVNFADTPGVPRPLRDTPIAQFETARANLETFYEHPPNQPDQWQLRSFVRPDDPALRVAEMRLRETIVARAQEQAAINLALRDITIPEREQTGAVRLLIDAQQEFARAKAAYEALADRTLTERLTSAEFAAYQQAIEQVTRARAEVDLEQQALRSPRSILEQLIDRLRTPAELAAYEEVREAFFEIARDADADTQSPAYQKALNDLIAARHNLEAVGYTVDQRDIDRELGSMQEQFQQVRDELARLEQEIPLRENYDAAAGAVQKIEAELAALRSRRDVLSADAASASERRILDRRIEAFTISLDRAKEIASFAERVRNNDPRTRAELDDLHARRNQLQTEFLQIQNQDTYLTRGRAEAGTLLGRLRSLFSISQPSLQTLERVRSGQQVKPKPLGEQIADLFRPGEREVSEAEAIVLGMEQSGKKTFASAAERQAEIVRIEQELSSFRSAELYARGLSEDRIGAILRAVGGEEFVSIEHLALRIGEVTDLTSLPALRAYAEEVWMRRNAGTDPRAQARVARNVYGDIEPTAARIVGEELARRIRESNTEINRNRQRSAQARQTRARAAVEGIVDGLFAADGRFIRGIRTNLLDAISSHDSLARYSPEARGVIAERIVRDTEIQFDKNSVARRLTEAITIRAQGVQFRSPNVVDLFAGAGSRQLLADANAMGRYQSYLARTPARIPIPAPIRAAVNAVERTVVNPLMRLGYRLTNGLNELFGGAARSRRTDRPVTLAPEAERLVTALAGYDGELFGSEGILTVRRDRDGFTQFARTDAGQRMLSDSDIGLLNETVKLYEQWQRSQDPAFQQIRALTGDYRDQAKFVIEAVRAFGRKGSRGAVLGALPGVGKTDVIMVLNLIVQTKMTSDAQIVLFPDRTIMQQFLRVDESGTSTLRTFLEEQFGPGSVLVLQSGQAPSPDAVNAARIIVSTRDIAFPLRETDTPGGRALRTKWGQSYIHGDEGHWTLSPHESYLSTYGESQRILETDEGRAYQEVISRLTGDDGPTTLLRLIDERARGQTPDGVRRAQDGRSGLYDADTERAILAEWLGERNTAGQLPDELKPLIGETDLAAIQDGLNAYLDSHFDDIALILARDLTVINRMADLLAGVPGGDYGQDGGVIAPREQNKITGRRYQSIAEQLLYNTVGAQIMKATGIDLSELTISPHSRDINFAMLMYEAKGFAIYTGTPEPIARIFRQAYGIDLVQIGDSAFTMVKARLEQGITDGTTRIFLNEADAQRARPSGRNDVWLNGDNRVANDVALARVTAEYADGTILFIVGANGEFVEGTVRTGKFVANTDQSITTRQQLNDRTVRLDGSRRRYVKFYEFGAHTGVDTANPVDLTRGIAIIGNLDETTAAQLVNRLRPDANGNYPPVDIVLLDAPVGVTEPAQFLDTMFTRLHEVQVRTEALIEVQFKETLIRNSVDILINELQIEAGKRGGLFGLGGTDDVMVQRLEAVRQQWKQVSELNYRLGQGEVDAATKLQRTLEQVQAVYRTIGQVVSDNPRVAARFDRLAGGFDRLGISFRANESQESIPRVGYPPTLRDIVRLVNDSSSTERLAVAAFTERGAGRQVIMEQTSQAARRVSIEEAPEGSFVPRQPGGKPAPAPRPPREPGVPQVSVEVHRQIDGLQRTIQFRQTIAKDVADPAAMTMEQRGQIVGGLAALRHLTNLKIQAEERLAEAKIPQDVAARTLQGQTLRIGDTISGTALTTDFQLVQFNADGMFRIAGGIETTPIDTAATNILIQGAYQVGQTKDQLVAAGGIEVTPDTAIARVDQQNVEVAQKDIDAISKAITDTQTAQTEFAELHRKDMEARLTSAFGAAAVDFTKQPQQTLRDAFMEYETALAEASQKADATEREAAVTAAEQTITAALTAFKGTRGVDKALADKIDAANIAAFRTSVTSEELKQAFVQGVAALPTGVSLGQWLRNFGDRMARAGGFGKALVGVGSAIGKGIGVGWQWVNAAPTEAEIIAAGITPSKTLVGRRDGVFRWLNATPLGLGQKGWNWKYVQAHPKYATAETVRWLVDRGIGFVIPGGWLGDILRIPSMVLQTWDALRAAGVGIRELRDRQAAQRAANGG
ncbi:MAG: hypothetical protein UY16_C0013G0043 [Candidatus Gottesmanbacteria bacterium GW2011_GWA2_47_9]|uniref:Uncharacterized protein n=1 Tax=Candidatus Gottesmanbacteria bacterium GW2011_GWA2_47_9 TaxID=1618445 RepID=A0A0G1WCT6_9BACT|nr:MAG: hypothetical protein UY16_C0013G0043 [Candidatus Gottesmanbacteria bacterium GW2011_GWA2_47_9]